MNIKIGDTLVIHCYKHNGMIHKSWKIAYVLDIKDDYIVLGNENVLVTKQDGRTWYTKEPAIMFFYKNRWSHFTIKWMYFWNSIHHCMQRWNRRKK